jgi:transcriptional regulator
MYTVPAFREDRVPVMQALMQSHPFAALVSMTELGLDADHVPLLLECEPAPWGRLIGHVARANPIWKVWQAQPQAPSLAIFQGEHSYITPSWYPSKNRTAEVVPTWNYVVVHAHGVIRTFEDYPSLLDVVTRLTRSQETQRSIPWHVSDAPKDYIDKMLKAIVGFEIVITRLEGKWKMSQNRSAEDRAGVRAGAQAEGKTHLQAVLGDLAR